MVYKRYTFSVILQLILILAVLFCIAFLFFTLDRKQYIYTFIVLLSLLSFQVYKLVSLCKLQRLILLALKIYHELIYPYPKT